MDPFSGSVDQRAEVTIVHVRGDVDIASAPGLRQTLIDVLATQSCMHLVVDLSEVGFIDSTGIGVIVGAHKRVTANGGRVSLVATTTAVREVLRITGLMRVWRVTDSVEEALKPLP